MTPKTLPAFLTILAACLLWSCGEDAATGGRKGPDHDDGHAHGHDDGHDDGRDDHGAHGGHMIEVGDHVAHVEFLHDPKAGTVTLHVTGKDHQTPLKLTHAPDLKVVTKQGPKVLATKPVGGGADGASEFQVTDPLLKADPLEGHIALQIGGKRYNPELEEHGHK